MVNGPGLSAEELFVAHAEFVAAFLQRLGVHDAEVEDVVQEVFLVVHRKGGYRPGPAKPQSWLGAIAVRLARSARRAGARRREDFDEAALRCCAAEGTTPLAAAETAEQLHHVERALATLDLPHRAAFVLYELHGEPCASIAAALEIPVGTVYSRLHHGRQRFLAAYEQLTQKKSLRGSEPQIQTAVRGA